MKLELIELDSVCDDKWWPDLYLRKGRRLAGVTPQQASNVMNVIRTASLSNGYGASRTPNLPLHDINGQRIGYVSYNGRVWLHDIDGEKEIPTCAS